MQLNEQNIPIDNNIKERKYIICCRKFNGVSAAACPCVGQIAVNSKLLAYLIYKLLDRWSRPTDGYKIAVMLLRRNNEGKYDAIERS